MVKGGEFHSIIRTIFGDVRGYQHSEQIQVNCPRCQENDGLDKPDGKFNLEINTAKRMFRCWKCDEPKFSGSLRRLVRTYGTKMDFEIYKSYAGSETDYLNESEDAVDEIVDSLPEEMILFSQMDVMNTEHFEAYNYLIFERKLTRDIILKYRLGFCLTGKYAKRIIVPSYDINGNINYFVARTYEKKTKGRKINPYDNPKANKNNIIFNEGLINWSSTVYLVEGVFDMLSFPVNTIPMLGKTISPTLFLRLKELKPKVVVLLDPDAYKNSIELYYQLYSIYVDCEDCVKIVKLPNNDDIDELRRNKGIEAVIECLYTARSLVTDDYFISKLKKPYEYYGKRDGSKNYRKQ